MTARSGSLSQGKGHISSPRPKGAAMYLRLCDVCLHPRASHLTKLYSSRYYSAVGAGSLGARLYYFVFVIVKQK